MADDFEDVKESFLNLMKIQCPETYVHIKSVCEISELLFDSLFKKNPSVFKGVFGLDKTEDILSNHQKIKDIIYEGALLHDTGKSSFLVQISNYYRPLTKDEFDMIKAHPTESMEFLGDMCDGPVKEMVLYHHLWHDHSSGYPLPITYPIKDQILIDILSVADTIDAATDDLGRAYTRSKTLAGVIVELNSQKGTRYSPEVVDAIDQDTYSKINKVLTSFKHELFFNVMTHKEK